MIPEIAATAACGTFAGAALYVSVVEQPARLSCGIPLALTEWRPSYKRGTFMQAPLAIVGSLLAFVSWWFDRNPAWMVGGLLLLGIVPFTVVVIFPTNRALESISLDESGRADQLLRRWGTLHSVRAAISFAAFLILLFALQRRS